MRTIAYYISDYGYGHASRGIAIIRELLKESDLKIIVCHSFALNFIMESLDSEDVHYREIRTDIGYFLEKDSIYPDQARLFAEYKSFVAEWDIYIQQERVFLKESQVDLVVSDISPIPFEAADTLGIPSIGISNFTWYTAYQGLIDDYELRIFKEAYQRMTYLFSLVGSQERLDVKTKHYGFFSRDIDVQEVNRIKWFVNPNKDKRIIFLGLGMKIGVSAVDELPIWDSPNCVFLVSSNIQVNRPNVYKIPGDYVESQNYIAASDLVISKAGWGMISEALSANVPLLILNRPSMKEDQNTIHYLKCHGLCETIDWDDFKSFQVNPSIIYYIEKKKEEHSCDNINEVWKIARDIKAILNN